MVKHTLKILQHLLIDAAGILDPSLDSIFNPVLGFVYSATRRLFSYSFESHIIALSFFETYKWEQENRGVLKGERS